MPAVTALAVAIALAASADASASGAPPASAAPASAPAPAADPLDRIVCRTEPTTGTRLGAHKTCHTMRDWNDIQRQTSEELDNGRQRGLTTGHDRGG